MNVNNDAIRAAELKQMKRLATSLLLLSCAIFIVAHLLEPTYHWLAYVRATAEAAMIGGLADWFAVTALFRHPLNIPIPHTAIVPKHKDRVGKILAGFVERHFLSPDVISAKLRSANVSTQLVDWLAQEENARTLARQAALALAAGAKATQHETVQELIQTSVTRKVNKTQVGPILGRALNVVIEDDRHQELFDEAVRLLAKAVHENKDLVRDRIDQETPWWVPGQVDDAIADKLVRSIDKTLQQIRDDPQHTVRERFDLALKSFIERLQTDEKSIARAEQIKQDFLNDDVVRNLAAAIWEDINDGLSRVAEKPDGTGLDAITRGLVAAAHAVKEDPELMAKIDDWVVATGASLVERYHTEAGDLITETVSKWDPQDTSRRIELAVGRDLQFIRINGTLVGGLAGLLIYIASRFF
jgi:uncharacterized membrane-anchored protein YjiN (DUF445 family)